MKKKHSNLGDIIQKRGVVIASLSNIKNLLEEVYYTENRIDRNKLSRIEQCYQDHVANKYIDMYYKLSINELIKVINKEQLDICALADMINKEDKCS